MTVPEYTAGDWAAVVRPGFVALLGPGTPEATVRAVWAAADSGVVGALAVLVHDGLADLPPFAFVAVDRREVHVALRGDVEVEVGGQVLSSGAVMTWTERVVEDAPGVVVRVAGAGAEAGAAAAGLPLADGVVRASAVRVALVADDAEDTAGPVGDVAEVAVAPVDDHRADVDPAGERAYVAAEQVDHSSVALEPLEDEEPVDEPAPPVVPWFPTHAVATPDEAAASDDAASYEAASDEAEVVAAAEALLQAPAPVVVEGASPDDHDGMTIMSADLAEIRDQLPAWAADGDRPALGSAAPAVAPARMVLSTGVVVDLDRAVLVGRAPQVARVTNRELPRLVTVPSPQQDISRTHAEVRAEGDVVLVTDLDSTNGVHVARPGQGARRLHPGEPSVVDPGEVVDLGDGVTFTVERGA